MNKAQVIDPKVYAQYIALTSKDYTTIPIQNKYTSAIDYYGINGMANWGNDLFHYCTIETLKNITKEARLRFSDVRFLNDTTEFKEAVSLLKVTIEHGKDSMDKELYDLLTNKKIFNELEKYFQRYPFKNSINQNNDIDGIKPICRVYTCSFSMDGDLLPMWNYYAHGAGGVSVNFRKLKENMPGDGIVKLVWGKVLYEEKDKRQCIEALLRDISELFLQIPDKKCREEMIQTVLVSAINNIRIFIKNNYYSTENEYRAVLIVPDEIIRESKLPEKYKPGYFSRGNIIIPYIDVKFEPKSIKNIIVGSGAVGEFRFIKLGLEDWLLQYGLNNVSIYQSQIPMRRY